MNKYYIYATLSFTLVSYLIEIMMSTNTGFTTFAGFNWFVSNDLLSTKQILLWLTQGLALSFAAYLYINSKTALIDGFRFGLITGLLFILLVLFNVMFQIDHSHYPFLADSLGYLVILQLLGFAASGWLFGLMYEVFAPTFPSNQNLWSLA